MVILTRLTADEVLDNAFAWLCKRRRAYPADADVWSFRQAWAQEKDKLKAALAAGRFRFGLLTRITLRDGEEIDLWSARDALVLKALAMVLARHLPVSRSLTHVKGYVAGTAGRAAPRRRCAGSRRGWPATASCSRPM